MGGAGKVAEWGREGHKGTSVEYAEVTATRPLEQRDGPMNCNVWGWCVCTRNVWG